MSTSYHPEFDGQIEVLNLVLEQYLCSFVHSKPSHWAEFITLAKWSYNTSIQSSMSLTHLRSSMVNLFPLFPVILLDCHRLKLSLSSSLPGRQSMLYFRNVCPRNKLLCNALHIANHRIRPNSSFCGGQVYVKLCHYRQLSVVVFTASLLSAFMALFRSSNVLAKLFITSTYPLIPNFIQFFISMY